MNRRDREAAERLSAGLDALDQGPYPLVGAPDADSRQVLIDQLIESIHRVRFMSILSTVKLSDRRCQPGDDLFDPLKAAEFKRRQGEMDEAFWLVFLFVHFGKNRRGGWRFAREVYGGLSNRALWDWRTVSTDPGAFRQWLDANRAVIERAGVPGGFGNHRKYENLDPWSPRGTGEAVETYVKWVAPPRTHPELVADASGRAGGVQHIAFDLLFRSMDVASFGRTARFDYLTTIGNLGLAPISPGAAYVASATGPARGARLLFAGSKSAVVRNSDLQSWLTTMSTVLGVGMQVLEDALCNWQKSPRRFKAFRG